MVVIVICFTSVQLKLWLVGLQGFSRQIGLQQVGRTSVDRQDFNKQIELKQVARDSSGSAFDFARENFRVRTDFGCSACRFWAVTLAMQGDLGWIFNQGLGSLRPIECLFPGWFWFELGGCWVGLAAAGRQIQACCFRRQLLTQLNRFLGKIWEVLQARKKLQIAGFLSVFDQELAKSQNRWGKKFKIYIQIEQFA